ncbi:MAG: DUF92 domain-containing protein [Chloroflexi bacterium]|nr:DUF92 domain-containing protein [Chloroflexota bacterium]
MRARTRRHGPSLARWLSAGGLGVGIAALAYWRRTLTRDGAIAAAGVGGAVFACGGLPAAGALLSFFGSSTALSRFGEARKRSLPLAQAKGSQRDAWQVLANGGVATLCAVAHQPQGLAGALAAAAADTWATELGLLSTSAPRLITTLSPVPPGTSGGVTLQGLMASLGGATVVGLAYAALGGGWASLRRSVVGGLGGALFDSLLGATLQAVYWCPTCQTVTEDTVHAKCQSTTQLHSGYMWMTNDTVNALATLSGAAIALAL